MAWIFEKHVVVEGSHMALARFDVSRSRCPHCQTRIEELGQHNEIPVATNGGYAESVEATLAACSICGWWIIAVHEEATMNGRDHGSSYHHLHSVLERCDVSTVDGPADELQRYLLHNYDQRFEVSPFVFEDVVGQVFRNHGFKVEATARSSDGGIDLFVAAKSGTRQAVEVKRRRGKIGVAFIREFAGALLLAGVTSGIYITTSSFTTGAITAAERYKELHSPIGIELLDADRFFDAMGFRKERVYSTDDDAEAPFFTSWNKIRDGYSALDA